MIELVMLYRDAILAGAVISASLAVVGAHIACRDQTMTTLCVSQGATLGVLVGILVVHAIHPQESTIHLSPFGFGFALGGVVYLIAQSLTRKTQASRNVYFAAMFAVLMGAAHLVASAFPSLENHMTQVFFGDLATLTTQDTLVSLAFGITMILILWKFAGDFSEDSFDIAVFGRRMRQSPDIFPFVSVALLCFSVQYLGFMFTIAALFIPTVCARYSEAIGQRAHLSLCIFIATLSTGAGFVLSLAFPSLTTVPIIVVCMAVLGASIAGLLRLRLSKTLHN